jgi:hypothetical protein
MIEIISINENGVTTKSFDELSSDEKFVIELHLNDAKLLCYECYEPIPDGFGAFCSKHKE